MLRFILLTIAVTIIGYWVRQMTVRLMSALQQPPREKKNTKEPSQTIELSEDEDGVFRTRNNRTGKKNKTKKTDDKR